MGIPHIVKLTLVASLVGLTIFSFLYLLVENQFSDRQNLTSVNSEATPKKRQFFNNYLRVENGQSEQTVISILGDPWERGERLDILKDALDSTGSKLNPYHLYYLRYQPEQGEFYILVFERQSKKLQFSFTQTTITFEPHF